MCSLEQSAAMVPPRGSRRSRWRAVLVPVLVLLGTAGVLLAGAWPMLRPAAEVRVVQAVFERSAEPMVVQGGDAESERRGGPTVQAAGWLEPEPYFIAAAALADGVVASVEVLEGERVEAGQVVARLVAEDSELRLRQAEAALADARAQLAAAGAELAAAEVDWSEPVEVERGVESGRAALAEVRGELAQLPAEVDAARAMLARLTQELEQLEGLEQQRATTRFEVVIVRQRVAAQRAEVRATEAEGPILEARRDRLAAELRAAERRFELRVEDRRRLDTARAARQSAAAAVDRAEVMQAEAALELERMIIRAPISGYVMRRIVSPGDKVARMMDDPHSAHIVHLYDPAELQVRVDVPLADAAHVYAGQPAEVIVEVLPDRIFKGEVLRSTHRADLQKNTLQFKVRVLDPDPILRPEMLTRVKFLSAGPGSAAPPGRSEDPSAGRVLVPESAIDARSDPARVWLVRDRRAGRGVLRPVEVRRLEERGDGWCVVSGAVPAGALLAVDFAEARPDQPVVIRTAPTPARGGGA